MSLYDIRENNYLQPNRYFSLKGEIVYVEKEINYTKIIVMVLNYNDLKGKQDRITVHFRGTTKKVVDGMIALHQHIFVMGDILTKDGKLGLDGKIIELYKTTDHVIDDNTKVVDPKDVNYDAAY